MTDYKGPSQRERRVAHSEMRRERREFAEAGLPQSREELNAMDKALVKLLQATGAFEMKITVLPPNFDSSIGSYRVEMVHPKGTAVGGGVHIWDAVFMARAAVFDALNKEDEIQSVPADQAPAPTPAPAREKVSAADLFP